MARLNCVFTEIEISPKFVTTRNPYSVPYLKLKCQILVFILILQKSLHINICTYLILEWEQLLSCRCWGTFFPTGLPFMLLFIINHVYSFWIKGRLVHLYYAINTYSKNKILIDHKMRTVKYTFLKSSGIDILQYTESVSLPKNIQSCKWHVQATDIYGFK